MKWVLIALFAMEGGHDGLQIHDFESKSACVSAKAWVEGARSKSSNFRVVCLPKGAPSDDKGVVLEPTSSAGQKVETPTVPTGAPAKHPVTSPSAKVAVK